VVLADHLDRIPVAGGSDPVRDRHLGVVNHVHIKPLIKQAYLIYCDLSHHQRRAGEPIHVRHAVVRPIRHHVAADESVVRKKLSQERMSKPGGEHRGKPTCRILQAAVRVHYPRTQHPDVGVGIHELDHLPQDIFAEESAVGVREKHIAAASTADRHVLGGGETGVR